MKAMDAVVEAGTGQRKRVLWHALREKLTENRTYYVRTDGNDGNSGLVNSSAGAFLTIQKGVDVVARLDINGYTVTIRVIAGTYTVGATLKNVVGATGMGQVVLRGDTSAPSTVVISTTSANCITANGLTTVWDVKGLKLQTTTAGSGLYALNGSRVRFSDVEFGACAGNHFSAYSNAIVTAIGDYTISGGCVAHCVSEYSSQVIISSRTVSVLANVSITYFAYANVVGSIEASSMTFSLGAFTVTGTRYSVSLNGVIYTAGGGATYLPGTIGGAPVTGGQYA